MHLCNTLVGSLCETRACGITLSMFAVLIRYSVEGSDCDYGQNTLIQAGILIHRLQAGSMKQDSLPYPESATFDMAVYWLNNDDS